VALVACAGAFCWATAASAQCKPAPGQMVLNQFNPCNEPTTTINVDNESGMVIKADYIEQGEKNYDVQGSALSLGEKESHLMIQKDYRAVHLLYYATRNAGTASGSGYIEVTSCWYPIGAGISEFDLKITGVYGGGKCSFTEH
jgi:hypothetical protein